MKRILIIFLLLPAIALQAQESAEPMPLSGFEEEAVFTIYKNEAKLGTIRSKLSKEGDYTRSFVLSIGEQELSMDMEIESDDTGLWESIRFTLPNETVTVKRIGDRAEYTLESKGTTFSLELADDHIIYDSYGPTFDSFMIRNYSHEDGGSQTFSRFIAPAATMDAELEYIGDKTCSVKGEDINFRLYSMKMAGIGLELWADEEGRIYLMDVPVQYVRYVREGYEELMHLEEADESVSNPVFTYEKKEIMIPMRDGVKLATDLYLPEAKEEEKFPAVLVRTPYSKEMSYMTGDYWARRGYATAIQDCRGRFASEGVWEPFINEAEDGYDTVEWLASQPWSNEKVGMIGGSYVGWVQLWAASIKPPHLTTIIPNVAPPDPFYNIPYEYGTFFILGSIWWAEILESEATADISGKALARISERKYEEILKKLPVIDLDKEIFGRENPYWRKWIINNTNNEYWEKANFMEKLKELKIPVFLQSGWFDGDGIGSKLNYMALKESESPYIKLILGPWGHTDQSSSTIGDFDFGVEAALDLQQLYLRWFDRFLKGMENNIENEPMVQIFTMFSNKWHTGDAYPLPQTEFRPLYLSSCKGANTSKGDGKLSFEIREDKREYDAYLYDPKDPTPWPSYYYKSKEEIEEEKKGTVDLEKRKEKQKAFHNSVTDSRDDILVYRTEPLTEGITVGGPLSAVIYASSSAVDTDWFVTLMDVDEEGNILPLARGTVRARFRNSTRKPELLEKGMVYEYSIDLWQTGITFQKGHRIRVEVSSALFPAFSRNLNTGGHNEMETESVKAKQRIYHSEEYPSHILLPVLKTEEEEK